MLKTVTKMWQMDFFSYDHINTGYAIFSKLTII